MAALPSLPTFLQHTIPTEEMAQQFLIENGLLQTEMACISCGDYMRASASDPDRYRCHKAGCRTECSRMRYSILEQSHLTAKQTSLLLWCFCARFSTKDAISVFHGELSERSIRAAYSYFRGTCSWASMTWPILFDAEPDTHVEDITFEIPLTNEERMDLGEGFEQAEGRLVHRPAAGGTRLPNSVSFDEAFIGKKKKHGRGTGRQNKILFAMVEAQGTKCAMYLVPDRTRKTLFPLIERHIKKNVTIQSDGFVVYKCLDRAPYNYDFYSVNHSEELVANDARGTHTNAAEGLFGNLRQLIATMHGLSTFNSYAAFIDEFQYRRNWKDDSGHIWGSFLRHSACRLDADRRLRIYMSRFKPTAASTPGPSSPSSTQLSPPPSPELFCTAPLTPPTQSPPLPQLQPQNAVPDSTPTRSKSKRVRRFLRENTRAFMQEFTEQQALEQTRIAHVIEQVVAGSERDAANDQ